MANTLYITCNLKPTKLSRSLQIGQTFLDAYTRTNPKDTIHHLDLYSDHIQRIDADVVSGWTKLRQGVSPFYLTEVEQIKVSRISALADQFISTDKYVFVTPLWNLGFPAEVKMYIDAVCQVGKSFKYTPAGAVGLLEGKKCLHIHSMGGMHHGRPEDHSTPYLKSIMNFMGVKDYASIVVEGVDALPEEAENLMAAAKAKAAALASEF